mmetsp:Transcript_154198/g.269739  ORF Transcript_154198/g.269739 Transcript_154198/m.269739 type:complete len:121 (+) Transcript_154198:719-1081(+)
MEPNYRHCLFFEYVVPGFGLSLTPPAHGTSPSPTSSVSKLSPSQCVGSLRLLVGGGFVDIQSTHTRIAAIQGPGGIRVCPPELSHRHMPVTSPWSIIIWLVPTQPPTTNALCSPRSTIAG